MVTKVFVWKDGKDDELEEQNFIGCWQLAVHSIGRNIQHCESQVHVQVPVQIHVQVQVQVSSGRANPLECYLRNFNLTRRAAQLSLQSPNEGAVRLGTTEIPSALSNIACPSAVDDNRWGTNGRTTAVTAAVELYERTRILWNFQASEQKPSYPCNVRFRWILINYPRTTVSKPFPTRKHWSFASSEKEVKYHVKMVLNQDEYDM